MGIVHYLHTISSSIGLHVSRRHSVSLMPHIQIRGSAAPWHRVQQLGRRSDEHCTSTRSSRLHAVASAAVAESAGRQGLSQMHFLLALLILSAYMHLPLRSASELIYFNYRSSCGPAADVWVHGATPRDYRPSGCTPRAKPVFLPRPVPGVAALSPASTASHQRDCTSRAQARRQAPPSSLCFYCIRTHTLPIA